MSHLIISKCIGVVTIKTIRITNCIRKEATTIAKTTSTTSTSRQTRPPEIPSTRRTESPTRSPPTPSTSISTRNPDRVLPRAQKPSIATPISTRAPRVRDSNSPRQCQEILAIKSPLPPENHSSCPRTTTNTQTYTTKPVHRVSTDPAESWTVRTKATNTFHRLQLTWALPTTAKLWIWVLSSRSN